MKRLLLVLAILTVAVPTLAASPETKPTSSTCKMNLKEWSQQKTETLTVSELRERMNTMVACADLSKKHEKQVRAYLALATQAPSSAGVTEH
jgi:hypothetical protein